MAWQQIAQSATLQHNESSFQIKLYQDTAGTPSVETITIQSSIKLTRGTPSAKDKFDYYLPTKVKFKMIDNQLWLTDLYNTYSDEKFKGEIYKDGSLFFTGNLLVTSPKADPTFEKTEISVTIYDGVNRLKSFTDLSAFSSGLVRITEVFRECLNELDYEIDLNFYGESYYGVDATAVIKPFYNEYFRIEDFARLKSNLSYYDLLIELSKIFSLQIFQCEGEWHIRQSIAYHVVTVPATDGIRKVNIDYSTGSPTASRISKTNAFSITNLARDKFSFKFNKLDRFEYKVNYKDIPNIEHLDWVNGNFSGKDTGWTINSGTTHFVNGKLIIEPTGEVMQESGAIDASEAITIKFSVACVRMVKQNSERLDHSSGNQNPLVRITYETTGGTTYYLDRSALTWGTTASDASKWGLDMWGVVVYDTATSGYVYAEKYNTNILEEELNLTVPAAAGTIKIYLYGGGTASGNNYPLEISALHNYCYVQRTLTETDSVAAQGSLVCAAYTDDYLKSIPETKTVTVLMHDMDAYLNASFWYSSYLDPDTFYYPTKEWLPDDLGILEYLAINNLKFNLNNTGIDIRFLPGSGFSFLDLFYGAFGELSNSYYLPIYEETDLLEDIQRYIALEHIKQSITNLSTAKTYEY